MVDRCRRKRDDLMLLQVGRGDGSCWEPVGYPGFREEGVPPVSGSCNKLTTLQFSTAQQYLRPPRRRRALFPFDVLPVHEDQQLSTL